MIHRHPIRRVRRAGRVVAGLLGAASLLAACSSTTTPVSAHFDAPGPWDWTGYGHDALHSFHGRTTLTERTVTKLKKAWYFPTGDSVTASPTVVGGTVYVGSWDDNFYAIDLATGKLDWKYALSRQDAVTPYPGEKPRDISSDGGLVTSSAWYEPKSGHRPDLVIFGGGYTLYALDAHSGKLYWRHDYTGLPEKPPDPNQDGTRIFSSPVVTGGKVIVGVDVDGQKGHRGYAVAADLSTGDPVWEYQTDVDAHGQVLNDGCGSVWSSGTLLADLGLVVFDAADCHFSNPPPTSETVFALHVADGTLAWTFRPPRADNACDLDFGGTPNAGVDAAGRTDFLGAGSKDGTYYSIDPATGALRWSTNVVFGGFSGGFIASASYDGQRVYGATSLGDFGRFEASGQVLCDAANPRDEPMQEPSMHAFDATTGTIAWQANKAASFAPTTVAGGMTFNGPALATSTVEVRDAATGRLLANIGLPSSCWSGVTTVGDALVVGTGTTYRGDPAGVEALTPDGAPPVVPGST
ncbi:MAG TPA: PQQ-binding-like beta-propeller repeat protein [Acidimicrobiales bacterium]|nr:PQQ-binding-like beta-propeller repeat protein [Acidimicrobiales bacterium]